MKKFAFGASKFFLGSVFGCVFVLLLFFAQCTYAKKQTFLLSNIALLLFGIALFVLFLSLDRLQQVKLSWHRPTVSSDVLIYGLCLLLFSAQLYISYNIYFETGWDAGLLTENARNLMHKQSVDIRYFSNYPNNLLYFFFELFVFKLNKYFSIFSDTQQVLCVIIVNCALNTFSCLLVYKTAARLTRKLYAFFGFFLAVLSFGLSPWNIICYTDALGLIFPILTLYVFIRPAKHKWLSYVLSAIIGTLGYFIKPQCFILLIAVFLIEGIYALSEKHLLKPLLLSLLTVAITFFAVKAGTGFLCSHYHIQLDNEQSFGIAHFWMMGLNPETKGVYSAEDVRYSRSFVTASERTQANIAVGNQRLQEMGFFGTLKQLAQKMLTLYNDGTFAWGKEGNFLQTVFDPPNTKSAPFLRSIYYPDGSRYLYFTTFEQFIWLMILLLGAAGLFSSFSHKHTKTLNILWLTWIGLTVFELLFEVRARYLYTNVPLFCVLAAVGIENIRRLFCRITEKLSARLPAKKSV